MHFRFRQRLICQWMNLHTQTNKQTNKQSSTSPIRFRNYPLSWKSFIVKSLTAVREQTRSFISIQSLMLQPIQKYTYSWTWTEIAYIYSDYTSNLQTFALHYMQEHASSPMMQSEQMLHSKQLTFTLMHLTDALVKTTYSAFNAF